MSTYVVGDLQGCLSPLKNLLEQVSFNPKKDTLWCTGDLINRGPESLATLRFIYQLGDACITVLGNHDLHLLAVAHGFSDHKKGDTLAEILAADDKDELLNWLRHQPLLHHQYGYTLVHAGIAPMWSLVQAQSYAREVENILQGDHYKAFLANMYGNQPSLWHEELQGFERLRLITNYFTRMRFCTADGALDLGCKQGLEQSNPDLIPWFQLANRPMAHEKILFGHWAALQAHSGNENAIALDSGCVWGNCMTLLRLDDGQRFTCNCADL